MVKGTLSNGFEYEINERIRKDARFLEILRRTARIEKQIQSGEESPELNAEYFEVQMSIIDKLFGLDQKERLYTFLEDEEGIVDYQVVALCANELINKLQEDNEIKNS